MTYICCHGNTVSEFAPDTCQSQIEKPSFETETFALNWDFYIFIIPNNAQKVCLETEEF